MASAVPVRFGHFTFDYNSRLLLWNGAPRHLSPKAQELLHVLIASRPRALSRQELFEALWPNTFVAESNLASVMNELRRALGDDAREPRLIRTVHSFGYAFCGEITNALPVHAAATLTCDGQSYPLVNGENIVGRGAGATIPLPHRAVSRRHARIHVSPSEISIEDLGSTNGTFVDGAPVRERTVITKDSFLVFGAVGARITPRFHSSTTASVKINVSDIASMQTTA